MLFQLARYWYSHTHPHTWCSHIDVYIRFFLFAIFFIHNSYSYFIARPLMEAVGMGAVAREEVSFRIALLYLHLLYLYLSLCFYFHLLEGILHQLPDQHGWLCHHWNHKVWLTISHHFFHLTMSHNFWQHLTEDLTIFDDFCQNLTVFDNFCQSLANVAIFA